MFEIKNDVISNRQQSNSKSVVRKRVIFMHSSALKYGKLFFDTYCGNLSNATVIDIGAQNVNGSLKDVCPASINYVGVDFVVGDGVDIVLDDPYKLPFDNDSIDIIVCSSCFEHSQFFWLLFIEIVRSLKPDGLLYINVPSNGSFHRYPVDCWRFYPDSGHALVAWSKRNGYPSTLLESFIGSESEGNVEDGEAWHDFVAVFVKNNNIDNAYKARIVDEISYFTNGYSSKSGSDLNEVFLSPDQLEIINVKQIVVENNEQIVRLNQTLAERDEQIARLNQTLAGRDEQIAAFLNSISWRLTAPVRSFLKKFK